MHIYLRGHFPDYKIAVSHFWFDTWPGDNLKSKTETKRALSQGRRVIRNLLLFYFSFQKQVCPKQMLHHRSSSLKTPRPVCFLFKNIQAQQPKISDFRSPGIWHKLFPVLHFTCCCLSLHLKPSPAVSLTQHHRSTALLSFNNGE